MDRLREDALEIMRSAIAACDPAAGVARALGKLEICGRVTLVAFGKAAYRMAEAALPLLPGLAGGIVITKYGHAGPPLPGLEIFEAGHPVPDGAGFAATRRAMELVRPLGEGDTVLCLISGGGSALFECPLIDPQLLAMVTECLLAGGADIREINSVRKRLSAVKGGRFGELCAPAKVVCLILSDVLGDDISTIASGPCCPDSSSAAEALAAAERYRLPLGPRELELLRAETPKRLCNCSSLVVGSARLLLQAAAGRCRELGYRVQLLPEPLTGEAGETGRRMARLALEMQGHGPAAAVAVGETVVRVTGDGLGGRSQHLALAAGELLEGSRGALVLSAGSDGTDGPTGAAGGICDGGTAGRVRAAGLSIPDILRRNDSYRGLLAAGDLIVTGPTGTNVNDLTLAMVSG